MSHLHFRELPSGQNSVVAIAGYTGYNQEDSILLNHGSVDQGVFRTMFYRSYRDYDEDDHCTCLSSCGRLCSDENVFWKMGGDGVVSPGIRVCGEDLILSRFFKMNFSTCINGFSSQA